MRQGLLLGREGWAWDEAGGHGDSHSAWTPQELAGGHRRTRGLLLTVGKGHRSGQRSPVSERTATGADEGHRAEIQGPWLPGPRPTHSLGWEPRQGAELGDRAPGPGQATWGANCRAPAAPVVTCRSALRAGPQRLEAWGLPSRFLRGQEEAGTVDHTLIKHEELIQCGRVVGTPLSVEGLWGGSAGSSGCRRLAPLPPTLTPCARRLWDCPQCRPPDAPEQWPALLPRPRAAPCRGLWCKLRRSHTVSQWPPSEP